MAEWFRAQDFKSGGPWYKSSTHVDFGSPTFNSLTVLLASHQLGFLIVYFLFRLFVYVFAVSSTSSTVNQLKSTLFLRGWHITVKRLTNPWPSNSRSNWNLEIDICGGRKTGEPGEKPSEQGREPATNSTHLQHRVQDSNPGHIGGRRARWPLRHPCSSCKYSNLFYLVLKRNVSKSLVGHSQ